MRRNSLIGKLAAAATSVIFVAQGRRFLALLRGQVLPAPAGGLGAALQPFRVQLVAIVALEELLALDAAAFGQPQELTFDPMSRRLRS